MITIIKFPTPAIVTFIGIVCAIIGIATVSARQDIALLCLFGCAIIDMLDGPFARRFTRTKEEKSFGIALDSLADVLAFVALPVALLLSLTHSSLIAIITATLYALSGITRLAVFTSEASPTKKTRYYRGIPVTIAGLVLPAVYAIAPPIVFIVATYLLFALLFILNIPIKKP